MSAVKAARMQRALARLRAAVIAAEIVERDTRVRLKGVEWRSAAYDAARERLEEMRAKLATRTRR